MLYATPLLMVLVVIEATDVVFAVDSIPAVFGVTRDVFIVYTSNIFAVLGLRALCFLVASVVHRLPYLQARRSALVLAFVGAKMLLSDRFQIPNWISLVVIGGLIGGAAAISLLASRKNVVVFLGNWATACAGRRAQRRRWLRTGRASRSRSWCAKSSRASANPSWSLHSAMTTPHGSTTSACP